MSVELLTPVGAALALLAVVPLAALALATRRAERARGLLSLPGPGPRASGPAVAVVACAGLLGLAAAQPVLVERETVEARTDAEAIVAVDTSRSMLAADAPGAETRFDRARAAAEGLAEALPEVPVGLASFTDRVVPHAFPTARHDVYLATLERVLAIEQPPPRATAAQVTRIGALGEVAQGDFFAPEAKRRLLFVLTDGESAPFASGALEQTLNESGIETILVHVWQPSENVYRPGGQPELGYVPDPASGQVVAALGARLGSAFAEDQLDDAVQAARDYLGGGPVESVGPEVGARQLAPLAVLGAILPLGLLLWWRNAG
jgi:hypothetical protein